MDLHKEGTRTKHLHISDLKRTILNFHVCKIFDNYTEYFLAKVI